MQTYVYVHLHLRGMKALPAEWRPYNILRISDTDANNKDWILMSTQQTSSLSTSMTRVQSYRTGLTKGLTKTSTKFSGRQGENELLIKERDYL